MRDRPRRLSSLRVGLGLLAALALFAATAGWPHGGHGSLEPDRHCATCRAARAIEASSPEPAVAFSTLLLELGFAEQPVSERVADTALPRPVGRAPPLA
jgi:hypothetical protein